MSKYDDASWHYGGEFPADLADEAGATHIGMFLAWALLTGLGSAEHAGAVEALRSRRVTPGQYLLDACDEKLTSDDFNSEGNSFALEYYALDDASSRGFIDDYDEGVGGAWPTLYHVPDTWATYDALAPLLERRLREWRGR